MKIDLEKIVISQELASKLYATGLNNAAMFHWWDMTEDVIIYKEGEPLVWRCGNLANPGADSLPAWTYEEIRIMIGNEYPAIDLREPRPNAIKGEEMQYVAYYLDRAENHDSGAELSGRFLLEMIQTKKLTVDEANRRYIKKFRPA